MLTVSVKTCDWKLKNVVWYLWDLLYIYTSWIADSGMIMQENMSCNRHKSAEDPNWFSAWADREGCVLCASDVRLVWGTGFVRGPMERVMERVVFCTWATWYLCEELVLSWTYIQLKTHYSVPHVALNVIWVSFS